VSIDLLDGIADLGKGHSGLLLPVIPGWSGIAHAPYASNPSD
jgi:hypothetical protein